MAAGGRGTPARDAACGVKRDLCLCFWMPQSVSCSRWDKIEKSDGQTLLSQAKSEATKAHNYQIVGCMSLVPSDFSILSLRELD